MPAKMPAMTGKAKIALLALALVSVWEKPAVAGMLKPVSLRTPQFVLEGYAVQGGWLVGTAQMPAQIILKAGEEERQLQRAPNGRFFLGIDRDAPEILTLTVKREDGTVTNYQFSVQQRQYPVQHIDGLDPLLVSPPPERAARIKEEAEIIQNARARTETKKHWYDTQWIWPVEGRITGRFGVRRVLNGQDRAPHYGVDIAAPIGAPVRAPAPGRVQLAESNFLLSGGTVLIDHGAGVQSAFLHLETLAVKSGQYVGKSHVIGTVGKTGRATGAHLDWRVNWHNSRLDAALLVSPR